MYRARLGMSERCLLGRLLDQVHQDHRRSMQQQAKLVGEISRYADVRGDSVDKEILIEGPVTGETPTSPLQYLFK